MRLFYQLVLLLSIFTTVIASIIFIQSFKTSTEYVQNQLYTDSVNTSHWLAMSMAMMSNSGDVTLMKSMLNAAFDSGYYQEISLVDTKGNVIYTRKNEVQIHDVPQWFVKAIDIQNETMSSDIVINWKRFGELRVYGHTGHAYQQLYHTLLELINTFIWTGVIGFFVLYILLSYTLAALGRIRDQADSVLKNKFIIENELPFTVELRSVVIAMNAMIKKVKDVFDRENEIMRQYHEVLYIDSDTKLHNRRYLSAKLPDYLHKESNSIGVYVMFSFDGLERFKKEFGFHIYSQCIRDFSDNLKKTFQEKRHTLVVRLNETDFLLLVPEEYLLNIGRLTENIIQKCAKEMDALDENLKKYLILGCSIGNYTQEDSPSFLLSRADQSVMFAKNQENFFTHIDQTNEELPVMGREQWRKELQEAFHESRMLLAFQPVLQTIDEQKHLLHEEIWLRLINKKGEILNTSYFIPIASSLGLIDEIDRYTIEKVFKYLKENTSVNAVAINLNGDFIKEYVNREWLRKELLAFKAYSKTNLWFEIRNNDVLSNLDSVQILFSMIKSYGYRVGIDHFTLPEDGADYLKEIRPDYIKANAIYLQDVMFDVETGKVRSNFTNLINSAGIEIIATHVDGNIDMDTLKEIKIDRFQGSVIAPALLK